MTMFDAFIFTWVEDRYQQGRTLIMVGLKGKYL